MHNYHFVPHYKNSCHTELGRRYHRHWHPKKKTKSENCDKAVTTNVSHKVVQQKWREAIRLVEASRPKLVAVLIYLAAGQRLTKFNQTLVISFWFFSSYGGEAGTDDSSVWYGAWWH